MTRNDCARAETLAGAIALEEATDGERDAYRRHLSACARCVETLGGEREIERVMSVVAQARDEESWEPDLRAALRDRTRMRRNAWKLGLGVGTAALAISLGVHLVLAGIVQPISLTPSSTVAAVDNAFHVTLEKRQHTAVSNGGARSTAAAPAAPARPLVVTHNVVALAMPRTANPKPAKVSQTAAGAAQNAAATDPAIVAALPPSEQAQGSISTLQTQSAAPTYLNRAESIAVSPVHPPVIRDVAPVGGKLELPSPPSIAAREMAAEGLNEATSYFSVAVDERGVPIICTIQKSSGIPAIDDSVCRSAMQARFTPRTVNGKPTTSIYRDAFVFLANATNDQ
jgi:Gram-negative bacterial TonB protein C-terminal